MKTPSASPSYSPFTLVLGGGGARGFAHVGVLRGLEAYGLRPHAIVGVSMGAVVGVTYALRSDWYCALLEMDTSAFPGPLHTRDATRRRLPDKVRASLTYLRAVKDLFSGWGVGERALDAGHSLLQTLTEGRNLEDARIPLAVSTTDLRSGHRYVFRTGNAAQAIYASSALAGIIPPLMHQERILADGAYADIAPIDVARAFASPIVIAVDPGQELEATEIRNGYQALMRAVEICHLRHADVRFAEADLVLRPSFQRTIDTLDFNARHVCIAAGLRAVRKHRDELLRLLTRPVAARDPAPRSA
jgi:NTE family protein